MPDIRDWMGEGKLEPWASRGGVDDSVTVGLRIQQRPTTIAIKRDGGVTLDDQVVRIEPAYFLPQELRGDDMRQLSVQAIAILGYKNHPTVPDTDIQANDRFFVNGIMYDVIATVEQFGDRILAAADITSVR